MTNRGHYGEAVQLCGDDNVMELERALTRMATKMNRRHTSKAGFLWDQYARAISKAERLECELDEIKSKWWFRLFTLLRIRNGR